MPVCSTPLRRPFRAEIVGGPLSQGSAARNPGLYSTAPLGQGHAGCSLASVVGRLRTHCRAALPPRLHDGQHVVCEVSPGHEHAACARSTARAGGVFRPTRKSPPRSAESAGRSCTPASPRLRCERTCPTSQWTCPRYAPVTRATVLASSSRRGVCTTTSWKSVVSSVRGATARSAPAGASAWSAGRLVPAIRNRCLRCPVAPQTAVSNRRHLR